MSLPRRRTYPFTLQYSEAGDAEFHALAPNPRQAARRLIRDLQADPYRAGTKQLAGQGEGTRRAVFGGRRIIYIVDDETRTISIERIDLRAIVYRPPFDTSAEPERRP